MKELTLEMGRKIDSKYEESRTEISKQTKELTSGNSRYGSTLVDSKYEELIAKIFKELTENIRNGNSFVDELKEALKLKPKLGAEFFKELRELKIFAGKVSAEILSKSIDFITERGKVYLKQLKRFFQRGWQKNNNTSDSVLQSILESVSYQDKDMSLAKHSAATILFSMYGQDGMNYNRLSFKGSSVLLVVTLLGLCIAHAVVFFNSKGRKINRITSKSGATMYFILGRSKLFSSEVFGEALVMSLLISEQNGSDEQSSLQIAYTLLFPNDCRMFLHIPIYLNGYVYRTEHKNNTIPIVPIRYERHTDGALNMPNDPGWHGVIINK